MKTLMLLVGILAGPASLAGESEVQDRSALGHDIESMVQKQAMQIATETLKRADLLLIPEVRVINLNGETIALAAGHDSRNGIKQAVADFY